MVFSCLIVATLVGTATLFLIPLCLCLCLCCIGFTAEGIRAGSAAAGLMSTGGGYTPGYVSVGQSLGAKGCAWSVYLCLALIVMIISLFKCSTATNFYCEQLSTNSSFCYNSTGNHCFTFFGEWGCA